MMVGKAWSLEGDRSMAALKLLIVEDDIASLELMAEVFTSLKAEVRPLNDSQKAARLINEEKFDGIFMDLEMPNVHGFDLARRIRNSSWNKTTPIIIVTGRDERETMQQAFALGATFFLQKPVDRYKLSALFRTVRGGMLENRRRSARVPIQTDVTCEVGSRIVRGVTWNLSQGGIQVEANGLQPKDNVRLLFRLPASSVSIDVMGTVIWTGEKRQGIHFTSVNAQNQESIRDFVSAVDE
jgi:CheY-like chemotaxis protein